MFFCSFFCGLSQKFIGKSTSNDTIQLERKVEHKTIHFKKKIYQFSFSIIPNQIPLIHVYICDNLSLNFQGHRLYKVCRLQCESQDHGILHELLYNRLEYIHLQSKKERGKVTGVEIQNLLFV